ncbi:TPA: ABC transporter ATP-binding protein [Candidatus Uhrbacteria bacterium]|nr:ABC transporter ATP-binding protein [Candidatus Uhrbacteria bacterium]
MKVNNRDVIKVFWQHSQKYLGRSFFVFFLIFLATLVDMIVPWVLKDLVDTVAESSPSPEVWLTLLKILGSFAGLYFFGYLAWRIQGYIAADVQSRIMADLEKTSMRHLLGHSYRFFTDNFAGSLVRKIGRLSRGFERILDETSYRFLPLIVAVIGTFIGLFLRFPTAAYVFAAWIFLLLAGNYFGARWKLKTDVARAAADSEVTGTSSDAISNFNTVQLFSGRGFENQRFAEVKEKWRILQRRGWWQGETIFAVQGFLMIIMEIGVLYLGAIWWMQGIFTVGDFVFLQSYLLAVIMRTWDLSRGFRGLFEAFADAKEMVEILRTRHEVRDTVGAKDLKVKKGKIEYRKIKFFFQKNRVILNNFSLSIKAGEKIALVGPSGAGKTTIVKLLLRLFDLKGGKILIDNQDIVKVTQDSLRDMVSLVPQDPILFHRTILDNIRYGAREATDEEVVVAAQKAHCHEFIENLPDGYNTYVGERGIKLSGGERQRVAIARAILKNSPILVLDEATSSLDSESESLIQDALRQLMKNRTVIVIAHRLSTIMMMDRIVVIEDGKVAASGTHNDLLEEEGVYQKLWRIQAGGFIGE